MSNTQLKKRAKNAQHLLATLFGTHQPPYSLAECQEFVAKLDGYPNWHAASTTHQAKPKVTNDPFAAFYNYDWRKTVADSFRPLVGETETKVLLHHTSPSNALELLLRRIETNNDPYRTLIVINAAGDKGGATFDRVFDGALKGVDGRPMSTSFGRLGQRIGLCLNPLAGMPPALATECIYTLVEPVLSERQRQCTRNALKLLVDSGSIPEDELGINTFQQSISDLICLADGGWSKDVDSDFHDVFPDGDMHNKVNEFMKRYMDELHTLLHPLDVLLTRLVALGLDRTLNPVLCKQHGDHREQLFEHPRTGGLHLVDIEFGSELVDHVVAILVAIRAMHLAPAERFGLAELPCSLEVILIHP